MNPDSDPDPNLNPNGNSHIEEEEEDSENLHEDEQEDDEIAPWLVEHGSSDEDEDSSNKLDPRAAALAKARQIAMQKAAKLRSSKAGVKSSSEHVESQQSNINPSITASGARYSEGNRWTKLQLPKYMDASIFDPSLRKNKFTQKSTKVLDILSASFNDDLDNDNDNEDSNSEQIRVGPIILPRNLTQTQTQAYLINFRLEEIMYKLYANDFSCEPRGDSPVPDYDANGQVTNSFEIRARIALEEERDVLLQKAKQMDPAHKGSGIQNPIAKLTAKVLIPVDKYPGYNFPGLLLGPLGRTQQAMSRETGAKIELRGRGMNKKVKPGSGEDDEEPHVNITADNEVSLQKAVAAVKRILIVTDDSQNLHKQRQLRELEKIRGTSREFLCTICGTPGHQPQDCPANQNTSEKPTDGQSDSSYKSFLQAISTDGSMAASNNVALLVPSNLRGDDEYVDNADSTSNWWLSKADDTPKITADTLPGAPPPIEYLSSRSHFTGHSSNQHSHSHHSRPYPQNNQGNRDQHTQNHRRDNSASAAVARARAAARQNRN